jgi:peptidoglycan/xylan/chitin deacetylase (PgdA/CDA1 family)
MKAILTFHSIDDSGSVLSFRPSMFAELVQGILASGIAICGLDELLGAECDNAVTLTFDDGMRSVFENALPVLREAQVPAHLYLTTDYVGRDNRWPTQPAKGPRMQLMDWDQVEACAHAGMLVESHTVNHPDLRALDAGQVEAECTGTDE